MNKCRRYHVPDPIWHAFKGIPFQKRTSNGRVHVIGDVKKTEGGIDVVWLKLWGRVVAVGSTMKRS